MASDTSVVQLLDTLVVPVHASDMFIPDSSKVKPDTIAIKRDTIT
ncbi:MAG: hypothetical protein R2744_13580 [Bacteroidales bacterium]